MTTVTIVRSLSVRNLTQAPDKKAMEILGETNQNFPIGAILGIAKKTLTQANKFDPSKQDIYFQGNFRAVDMGGNTFKAGTLYLPAVAGEELANAMDESQGEVEFGFNFGLSYSEKSPVGYTYTVSPFGLQPASDPLERLLAASGNYAPGAGIAMIEMTPHPDINSKSLL